MKKRNNDYNQKNKIIINIRLELMEVLNELMRHIKINCFCYTIKWYFQFKNFEFASDILNEEFYFR